MPRSEDSAMRMQAEDVLHNSEERVRLILDSATEAICGCDSEGTCLFSNPSAARMLGYDDPAELLGKNMHALEHHTRKDGTPYPLEECPIYIGFQKGESVHRDGEVFWRRDGTSFPVEYWFHPVVREGRTLSAVITFIDITDRKQAEAALRKSEERSRILLQINNAIITNLTQQALLHSISEALHPVFPFDRCAITLYQPERDSFRFLALEGELLSDFFKTGLELSRNETCGSWVFEHLRILGYDDPADLIGKNMHALEHHTRKDGTPYPIEECPIYIGFQKNEDVHRDDEVYWRKDGTSFPVEFWSHIVVREGKTLGAVITFIDITERKQAESALRKSEE
ncbi:MAG: PAS domain S-box protein, partial [Candidatus Acidiferrales bacterium]